MCHTCWSTVCCVADLLVDVALVSMKINFDLCWISLSLSLISSSSDFHLPVRSLSSLSFYVLSIFFLFISVSLHLVLGPVLYMDATSENPRGVVAAKAMCLLRTETNSHTHSHPEHQHVHSTPHHNKTPHNTPPPTHPPTHIKHDTWNTSVQQTMGRQ